MEIGRRVFLGGVAAASVPVATIASLDPQQRLKAAIEELQQAAALAMPEINDWRICIDEKKECPLLVASFKR